MITVYLSLGCNLGDRARQLQEAVKELQKSLITIQASSILETAPLYELDQPFFLNQAVRGKTFLTPQELLNTVKSIEKKLGRIPSHRYGPRFIDIDIIFYGKKIIEENNLTIPHPAFHERLFVLKPLYELAPALTCPRTGLSVEQLLTKAMRVERWMLSFKKVSIL